MDLTAEQKRALEQGEAVPIIVDHADCILLRRDVYERARRVIGNEDEFNPQDAYPLVNEIMREDDQDDPLLDSYQKYRP